jgi:hypothetical protein
MAEQVFEADIVFSLLRHLLIDGMTYLGLPEPPENQPTQQEPLERVVDRMVGINLRMPTLSSKERGETRKGSGS